MNQKMTDSLWQGQSVWLVGASTGIGLATAKALYLKGAKVVVSARKEKALLDFVQAQVCLIRPGLPRGQPEHLYTQPVGLGRPPYLVIGFIGPVIQSLKTSCWSSSRYLANLRMGGTLPNSS